MGSRHRSTGHVRRFHTRRFGFTAALTGVLLLGSTAPLVATPPAAAEPQRMEAPDPVFTPDAPPASAEVPIGADGGGTGDTAAEPLPAAQSSVLVGTTTPTATSGRPMPPPTPNRVTRDTYTPTSHRTERSDGTGHLEVSAERRWFQDERGRWRDIDLSLVPDGQGGLTAAADAHPVRFGRHADGTVIEVPTAAGDLRVSYPDAAAATGTVGGDDDHQLRFDGALPGGRDLVLSLTPAGAKEEAVVASHDQGGSYHSHVSLPAGVTARQGTAGVDFLDADGTVLAAVTDGWAFDSTDAFPGPVRVTVVDQGRRSVDLETSIDPAWFDSADRVFPVTIDPGWTSNTVVEFPSSGEDLFEGIDTYVENYFCSAHWMDAEAWIGVLPVAATCGGGPLGKARMLVRLPTDDLGDFAGDQIVTRASIDIQIFGGISGSVARQFNLHELLGPVDLNTVWANQPAFSASASAAVLASSAASTQSFTGVGLVALVQKWFDSAFTNHGVVIRAADESDVNTFRQVRSRPNVQQQGPLLSVDYLSAPPTVTATPLPGGAQVSWSTSQVGAPLSPVFHLRAHDLTAGTFGSTIDAVTSPYTFPTLNPAHAYSFEVWATSLTGGVTYTGPKRTSNTVSPLPPIAVTASTGVVSGGTVDCMGTGPTTYNAPEEIGYCARVENLTASARSVTPIVETLPDHLAPVAGSITFNGVACGPATTPACTIVGQQVRVTGASIPGSTTRTISYRATIDVATGCEPLIDQVQATDAASGLIYQATAPVRGCAERGLSGLGFEPWWSFDTHPIGPNGSASVNVANGNLVVQQTDATPVQGHGRQDFVLRRTYNSDAPDTIGLFDPGLGTGWGFNFTAAGDLGGGLGAGLVVPDVIESLLTGRVTLVDRDGTRHAYDPADTNLAIHVGGGDGATFNLDVNSLLKALLGGAGLTDLLGDLFSTLQAVVTGLGSLDLADIGVCVDTSYTRPDGVHTALWRFVAVKLGNDTCSYGANEGPNSGQPLVLGYATMRTDRVSQLFSVTGQLLSEFDAAGNELRYQYELPVLPDLPLGRVTKIYEPRACPNPASSTCRALSFQYVGSQTKVTDPAGRVTTYTLNGSGLLTGATTTATVPSGTKTLDSWSYTYQGTSGEACGGDVGQLCSVTDPRGNATRFHYDSAGRVDQVIDRHDVSDPLTVADLTSTFTYNGGNCLANEASTDVDRAGETTRYAHIDCTQRVHDLYQGTADQIDEDAAATHTEYDWDTGPGCAPAPDNNLCSRTVFAGTVDEPVAQPTEEGYQAPADVVTDWTYNPEGQVLSMTEHTGSEDLRTDYEYIAHYAMAGSAVADVVDAFDDPPTARPSPAYDHPLYVLSDRTGMRTPRGVTTDYVLDNDYAEPVNEIGATCGGGNSGLLCSQTQLAYTDADLHLTDAQTTTYTYDTTFGQRTSMVAPDQAETQYIYYADNETDITGETSAGGWLKAVIDASDEHHFAAFGYDRAGNVVRTWDRDATDRNGVGLASYPGTLTSFPAGAAETRYGEGPPADAYRAPWRWVTAKGDQLGDTTTYELDANGNVETTTTAAGRTTDATYTARDQLSTRTQHDGSNPDSVWTFAYDGNGNQVSVTDPLEHERTRDYDGANRAIAEHFTRGEWTGSQGDFDALYPTCSLDDDVIGCASHTAYDGTGFVVASTTPAGETTWFQRDAAGRTVAVYTPRTHTTDDPETEEDEDAWTWTVDRRVFDADGNVTIDCRPRQVSDEASVPCGPGAHFATHTDYDALNRPYQVTRYREVVDADGVIVTGTFEPLVTATQYELAERQTIVTDPNGHETTTQFDALGRRASVTGQRGVDYTSVSLPDPVTSWEYSPAGDVLSVTIGDGTTATQITSYAYDAAHRIVDQVEAAATTDAARSPSLSVAGAAPSNLRSRNLYDADGLVVGTYDPRAFTASATDPDERYLTRTDYDGLGRPVAQWTPYYDTAGAALWDPNGAEKDECPTIAVHAPATIAGVPGYPSGVGLCVTRGTYDTAGNLTKMSNPTQIGMTNPERYIDYSYTDDNLLAAVNVPNPAGSPTRIDITETTYDADGRAVIASAPSGEADDPTRWETRTAYTGDGLTGSVTQLASDGDPEHPESVSEADYDLDGHQTEVRLRTSASTPDQVTTTEYYADGSVHESATGSATTRYAYDDNGNPSLVWSPSAVAHADNNTAGTPTVNLYTDDDLLAAVIDPVSVDGTTRRATTYGYDLAGRKLREDVAEVTDTDVDDIVAAVTGGASDAVVDPGGELSWAYAPNGWLLTETGRNAETIGHTYAANGQELTNTDSTSDAVVTNTWFLNGWARSSGTAQPGQDSAYTAFRYYGDGQLAAKSFDDNPSFSSIEAFQGYAYDDARVLTSIVNFGWNQDFDTWTYQHDQAGQPVEIDHPDGLTETFARNADGTVDTAAVANGSGSLDAWTYGYDGLNRVTSRLRSGAAAGAVDYEYTYDDAGRLDDYTVDGSPVTVDYDPNGNRIQLGSSTVEYRADNSIGSSGFAYDVRGALVDDGCSTSTYDGFDRLASASAGGSAGGSCVANPTTYAYDGLGRQTTVTAGTGTPDVTALRYIGTSASLWGEESTSGDHTSRYVTDPSGAPVGLASGSMLAVQHVATDGQANTSLLTDDSGASVCGADYDPWGSPETVAAGVSCLGGSSPPSTNTIWYRGARQDTTTGNYQFGDRTYSPATASWLTPDSGATSGAPTDLSVGVDPLTANRYSYVNGDPINLIDPFGHGPCWKHSRWGVSYPGWCDDPVTRFVRHAASATKDFALGLVDAGKDTATGLFDAVVTFLEDPVGQGHRNLMSVAEKVDEHGWVGGLLEATGAPDAIGSAGHCVGSIFTDDARTAGHNCFSTVLNVLVLLVAHGAGGEAAEAGSGAVADDVAVIGRQADTVVAQDWAGHEVLNLPADEWSIARNDQWVQSVVERKMDVYVGSNPTWENIWDATNARPTVFGRELQQFTDAGYTWDGWYLRAPGGM